MSNFLELSVNEQKVSLNCLPGYSLLTLLREKGWTGVHKVCQTGDCGSCTVWVDNQAVHSCIYPAQKAAASAITTIEGLASIEELSDIQKAFIAEQGFQCGYCTPGMIMSALQIEYNTEQELKKALDGNLCRCTGYQSIIDSIQAYRGKKGQNICEFAQSPYSQVGQNIAKQDGPAIVTGKPIYAEDVNPEGLSYLKVVRSPYAHARIKGIDISQAKALSGVYEVLTYQDVRRYPHSNAGHIKDGPDPKDRYLLDNKVRYVGERIAAVIASTEAIAEKACDLIKVDYEILPHVLDPLEAMRGEIVIHDEPESSKIHDAAHNIVTEVKLNKGDIEGGFLEADLILEETYDLPPVQHCHLEPHTCTTYLEEDRTLVVRVATQVPFHSQRILAELLDKPPEEIRVIKPNIGGGFGNKQDIIVEDLCALATLKTGRPVRWTLTRVEEFIATNSRHAVKIKLKIGAKKDGTLVAMEMEAIGNAGAYGNHSMPVIFFVGCFPLGLYRCPNQRFLGIAVYTNTMPAGAFRGYGATQGGFAVESLLDRLAHSLELDPVELRLKNLITPEDKIIIGREHEFHVIGSYGMPSAIKQVIEKIGHPSPTSQGTIKRGIGFAGSMLASGLANIHHARVRLALSIEGKYQMRTGAADIGTGSDTTLRQIAAEVLGVEVSEIELIAADTKETPFDAGAYASGTLVISGGATQKAALALKAQILKAAAELLQVPVEELHLKKDKIEQQGKGLVLMLPELLTRTKQLEVEEEYSLEEVSLTFTFLGVEIEVDTETGRITVVRSVTALDIGQAINPRICIGQAQGGFVMGLGYALTEEIKQDAQGKTINPSFRTYRLPLAKDVPPLEVILVETTDAYGPFGAKGVGEIGVNCAAPAIANALFQATGLIMTQLPMTPERVINSLHS